MILPWGTKAVAAVTLMLLAALISLLFEGAGRLVRARGERRVGPPLFQPFYELVKLFGKQEQLPQDDPFRLHHGGPLIAGALSLTTFLYMPVGSLPPVLTGGGDLILVVTLLFLASLALVLGGSASDEATSGFDVEGELTLLAVSSLPLAVVLSSLAWFAYRQGLPGAPFSLETFVAKPVWIVPSWSGLLGTFILMVAFLCLLPLQAGSLRLDLFEGLEVRYSGRGLLLFRLARYFRSLALSALAVSLFFPGSLGRWLGLQESVLLAIDFLFFWVKVFVVQMVTLFGTPVLVGRFRTDLLARFFALAVTGFALAGLLLLYFDVRF
ncbi:MAG: NADH-quinone oxidoreductase subunit H [Synergistaceae bacterium]|nr:NADH-quinone oxidoreductase subunit H [Synergistaceae bacterium]